MNSHFLYCFYDEAGFIRLSLRCKISSMPWAFSFAIEYRCIYSYLFQYWQRSFPMKAQKAYNKINPKFNKLLKSCKSSIWYIFDDCRCIFGTIFYTPPVSVLLLSGCWKVPASIRSIKGPRSENQFQAIIYKGSVTRNIYSSHWTHRALKGRAVFQFPRIPSRSSSLEPFHLANLSTLSLSRSSSRAALFFVSSLARQTLTWSARHFHPPESVQRSSAGSHLSRVSLRVVLLPRTTRAPRGTFLSPARERIPIFAARKYMCFSIPREPRQKAPPRDYLFLLRVGCSRGAGAIFLHARALWDGALLWLMWNGLEYVEVFFLARERWRWALVSTSRIVHVLLSAYSFMNSLMYIL